MCDYTGRIVRATAGRDKGGLFLVVGMDQARERLLLADGKRRRATHPKPKKLAHVTILTDSLHRFDHPAVQKLTQGEALSDKELRRTLCTFRDEMEA